MQFRRVTYSALAAAALFGFASTSASAPIINFEQSGASSPGGSVSYDGEGGALTGSGISFGQISLNNATAPQEDTLTCDACVLSFSTGNNNSASEGPIIWEFSGGGSLSISGQAKDSSGNVVAGSNTDLVTGGTFTGVQVVNKTDEDSLNASLSGVDSKNSDLLAYFGLDKNSDFTFSDTVISLGKASFDDDGGFDAGVTGGDFQDELATAVPEPRELGLFAIGVILLAGGLGYRRRSGAFTP